MPNECLSPTEGGQAHARGPLLRNGRPVLTPLPEEDDVTYWKHASLGERGQALAGLLGLVDAIGHFPPKPELAQVFPRPGQHCRASNE